MPQQIKNFIVIYDKDTKESDLYTFGHIYPHKDKYIIGYKYKENEGEYIIVKDVSDRHKDIEIENDKYASIPVYIYEDNKCIIVSSSITKINEQVELNIDSEMIYQYFAFGHLPNTNKTIYKNITTLRPKNKIIIDKKGYTCVIYPNDLFCSDKSEFYPNDLNDLVDIFLNSIKDKVNQCYKEKSVFCLSGGFDTLLGLLGMNENNIEMDTATWGLINSSDITEARARHNLFSSNTGHFEAFIINSIKKVKIHDLIEFANLTGGISPSSSIYLYYFIKDLISKGKLYHFYCDFYEVTRRWYKSEYELKIKYTTPLDVIAKNIKDKDRYIDSLGSIKSPMEYYFFDRCIKGAFYKSTLISQLGGVKVTLPLDSNFLNYNYNYIKKSGFTYNILLDSISRNLRIDLNKQQKDFPFNPRTIIEDVKEYFIALLDMPSSQDFNEFFNMNRVRDTIITGNYIPKEEWFLLRLLNLLIFKQEHSIGLV